MSKPTIDDYLNQGIYGPKETNPDERRKFLGTLRERIEIALTKAQVMEDKVYSEVEHAMRSHPQIHLFLDGNMTYSYLSKYVKTAAQYQIPYTMVSNKDYHSEIGLVLAHKEAVDKENIFVKKEYQISTQKEEKKGLFSFFNKILG